MPKLKTRKGAAKRFQITKKGRVKRSRAGMGHLLGKKTSSRKRHLRKAALVSRSEEKTLKQLLYH